MKKRRDCEPAFGGLAMTVWLVVIARSGATFLSLLAWVKFLKKRK